MKKNEIRTDEETPLTTPVDVSVLEYYRPSPEEPLQIEQNLFEESGFVLCLQELQLKLNSISINRK